MRRRRQNPGPGVMQALRLLRLMGQMAMPLPEVSRVSQFTSRRRVSIEKRDPARDKKNSTKTNAPRVLLLLLAKPQADGRVRRDGYILDKDMLRHEMYMPGQGSINIRSVSKQGRSTIPMIKPSRLAPGGVGRAVRVQLGGGGGVAVRGRDVTFWLIRGRKPWPHAILPCPPGRPPTARHRTNSGRRQ